MRPNHKPVLFACVFGVLALGSMPPVQSQAKPAPATFEKDVLPVTAKYCAPCHTGKSAAGGVDFSVLKTKESASSQAAIWERVVRNLKSGAMPPKGSPQPTALQRTQSISLIESALSAGCNLNDPGRVTLRRLNRTEYNRTIQDLTGVDFRPGDDFPSDDVGYGFDNIGDVLSISPLLMEKYLDAASTVAERAVPVPQNRRIPIDVAKMGLSGGVQAVAAGLVYASNGEARTTFTPKVGGDHKITVLAGSTKGGPEVAKMEVVLDEFRIAQFDVANPMDKPISYTVPLPRLERKAYTLRIRFVNDYYNAETKEDRNLVVTGVVLDPPAPMQQITAESRRLILGAPPVEGKEWETAVARLKAFATRAYRRPLQPEEEERILRVAKLVRDNREPYEAWIQIGVTAILASPGFLFRTELDPVGAKGARGLNDYEIASRLSYFLWSGMPDETLFSLAAQGKLKNRAVLVAQTKRMLADKRAFALAENFAGQWLELRKLNTSAPDPTLFPAYSPKLRSAMQMETMLFFDEIVKSDRSVLDFLSGKFTFVNGDLAKLYGIPGVTGEEFRKVALPDDRRAGVLTQASVLTLTSNPTRTSPVKRGKWVLEQILGTPPPPPPPGASQLSEAREKIVGKTLRQRMEMHRKDPACATCHQRMDPIGFGLENFDGIGAWRKLEGDTPVDASGVLPGGQKFAGPAQLRAILLGRKKEFVASLAEKMMVYATGRGLTANDKCFADDVRKRVEDNQYRFSSLIAGVALSEPFLKRIPEPKR